MRCRLPPTLKYTQDRCRSADSLSLQENEVKAARYFSVREIPQELLWGQRQRIKDAINCHGGGVAWRQNIPYDNVVDRAELYEIQRASGLSKLEFYKTHFGLDDPENDKLEF
jgi:hypothetical protein